MACVWCTWIHFFLEVNAKKKGFLGYPPPPPKKKSEGQCLIKTMNALIMPTLRMFLSFPVAFFRGLKTWVSPFADGCAFSCNWCWGWQYSITIEMTYCRIGLDIWRNTWFSHSLTTHGICEFWADPCLGVVLYFDMLSYKPESGGVRGSPRWLTLLSAPYTY